MDIVYDNNPIRRRFQKATGKLKQRLDEIRAAESFAVLKTLPGRFHQLSATRAGDWACHLEEPYRLIFRPLEGAFGRFGVGGQASGSRAAACILENEHAPPDVTPPGSTLEEALEECGMSQAELAERTGRPKKTINEIVRGQAAITPDTAIQLERVLGIPASFWNTRQQQYEESVAGARAREKLLQYKEWTRNFPLSQMVRLGWIPREPSPEARLESLLRFFRIGSPDEWQKMVRAPRMGTAYRESAAFKTNPYSLTAWLQKGETEASSMDCRPFDKRGFVAVLRAVLNLVRELPRGFDESLVHTCAGAGVAVVFVPLIKGVHACGATRWLRPDRAMILLSLRGEYEDIFWFSFYHEAAHILMHGKKDIFVEEPERIHGAAETQADDFARDSLIEPILWKEFVEQSLHFTAAVVEAFAFKAQVSPGVVVGRLQHEEKIQKSQLNSLRRKVDFAPRTDA